MKKSIILNFQNIESSNIDMFVKPFEQVKFGGKDNISILIVREPFSYLDAMLSFYLEEKKSVLFSDDILKQMQKLKGDDFLVWFDSLSFIPFYNPQTFYLDIRKRISYALKNLESFDYVVSWEEIELFQQEVMPNWIFKKRKEKELSFSFKDYENHPLIDKFLQKDQTLYTQALELWNLSKMNQFKTLKILVNNKKNIQEKEKLSKKQLYKGYVGHISNKIISGWAVKEGSTESLKVEIYKNGEFLARVNVDQLRMDVKKLGIHPTGVCGFRMVFKEDVFSKKDRIEVKIVPGGFVIPFGKASKEFFNSTEI